MIESLDPGQLQEMALRTKEVDRQYSDLRKQYNELKHRYDSLLIEHQQSSSQQQENRSIIQSLQDELAQKDTQNRALRILGDEHLMALSSLQTQIAEFYNRLPKHLPRNLFELAQALREYQEPCNEMRIQQERMRSTERKLVQAARHQEKFLSYEKSLKDKISSLQQQLQDSLQKNKKLSSYPNSQPSSPQKEFSFLLQVIHRFDNKPGQPLSKSIQHHLTLIKDQQNLLQHLEEQEIEYRMLLEKNMTADLLPLKKSIMELRGSFNVLQEKVGGSERSVFGIISGMESEAVQNQQALNHLIREKERAITLRESAFKADETERQIITEMTDRSKQQWIRSKLEFKRTQLERDKEKLHQACNQTRARMVEKKAFHYFHRCE